MTKTTIAARVYPWFVIGCCLVSAACLSLASARYIDIGEGRGGGIDLSFGVLPGGITLVLWVFCTRPWMRRAGIAVSTLLLVYSGVVLARALGTDRLAGDMGFMTPLVDLASALAIAVLGSLIAALVFWLLSREQRGGAPRLNR
jgi:hypothetical protein